MLEKAQVSDAGEYTAKGINDEGEASTSCSVEVTQPMEEPKFSSLLREGGGIGRDEKGKKPDCRDNNSRAYYVGASETGFKKMIVISNVEPCLYKVSPNVEQSLTVKQCSFLLNTKVVCKPDSGALMRKILHPLLWLKLKTKYMTKLVKTKSSLLSFSIVRADLHC